LLLVEDNPQDAELAILALKKRNVCHSIHVVKDGAEALDFLFKQEEDRKRAILRTLKLILLDLRLPGIDGFEVLKTIKSNEATKPIPVVVFTSSKEEIDIIKASKFGANSYIKKPINAAEFATCLETLSYYWLVINQQPF
jgi:two-component system response regulator